MKICFFTAWRSPRPTLRPPHSSKSEASFFHYAVLAAHLMASTMTLITQKTCYHPSKLSIYPIYSTFSPSQAPPIPFTLSTLPKTYFIIPSLIHLQWRLLLKPLLPSPLPPFLHNSFLPYFICQSPNFSNFQLWHKRGTLVLKVWFFGTEEMVGNNKKNLKLCWTRILSRRGMSMILSYIG